MDSSAPLPPPQTPPPFEAGRGLASAPGLADVAAADPDATAVRLDAARLAAVRATGLVDTEPEAAFDRLTRLAVTVLGVPAAFLSLVDESRDFYKAATGLPEPLRTTRELTGRTFCHAAISRPGPLVIPDTAADPVHREVPTVRSLGVAAYVGVPLVVDGQRVGAFCAIDVAPHAWTAAEVDVLSELAESALREIALRRANARLEAKRAALADANRVLADQALELELSNRQLQEQAAELEMQAEALQGAAEALTERTTAAETSARALARSEERYALAARATSNAIWDWDVATDALSWSAGISDAFGYAPDAVPVAFARWSEAIHPDDRERVLGGLRAVIDGAAGAGAAEEWRDEYRFRRGDGTWAHVIDRGHVARGPDRRAARMIGAMEDVTARVQLEERLRQAEKMEAVGQLAGGVAHDFNNLLTVISGNVEFLRGDLPLGLWDEHPARQDVEQIADAADRARGLVRQLLAFSRKQPVHPQRLRLAEVVRRAEGLLRRVIGEEIVLAVHVADEDAVVEADAGQLEQVLLNLAVNARDAMLTPKHGTAGRGGTLDLEVDTVTLDAAGAGAWGDVPAGRWTRLRVRDTGHGMDAETRARAFEPFFTTKEVGMGTGLGLASVFGIVRQAGGAIRVDSVPGRGTAITILLPFAPGPSPDSPDAARAARPSAGRVTVLLVEDEAPVRATARRMLERHGYAVLEARHGADALLLWKEHQDVVRAVVTDLRMPELGGRELVVRLRAERPDTPVVFVSGYADQGAHVPSGPHEAFVEKPFTSDALLEALAGVLRAAAV